MNLKAGDVKERNVAALRRADEAEHRKSGIALKEVDHQTAVLRASGLARAAPNHIRRAPPATFVATG